MSDADKNNVEYFPRWKKGATVGERLRELAYMADADPEKFANLIVMWTTDVRKPNGLRVRYVSAPDEMTVIEMLGLIEMVRYRFMKLVHHEEVEETVDG